RERLHRWQQIETVCGFQIVNNPGIHVLMSSLNLDPSLMGGARPAPTHFFMTDDLDDLDEEIVSPISMQYAAWLMGRRYSERPSTCSEDSALWKFTGLSQTLSLPVCHTDLRPITSLQPNTSSSQDLSHSDSDSSLPYGSEARLSKVSSSKLMQKEDPPTGSHAPNGANRHLELANLGALQRLSESPQLGKRLMEKSSSLGEISLSGNFPSHSDSSRSHSPSSTEAETPSPGTESKQNHKNTRIPQLAGKKNVGEEDGG
ncbi:PREDICTED: stromal interaction molecule 1-like, partial [Nanorana parkeri]|uniref:stromal interaction molecule 1-like n=1 Tax=Nanorana parkeri TaxID=125878 RepID=UPI000854DA46